MIESGFITSVRKLLEKHHPSVYALKLNLPYTAGVPDCWYCGPEADIWVEYKYMKKVPKMVQPRNLLTALQAKWITERSLQNRNVAVVIGSPEGHVILPGLTWTTSLSRDAFHAQAVETRDVSNWIAATVESSGPAPQRHN